MPGQGYQTTDVELYIPGLDPAHDGVRIAHLSDIHVGINTPEARVVAAVSEVNEARPDLVFLTGDYVTYSRRPLARLGALLGGFAAPVHAVLGNHDHYVGAARVEAELARESGVVLRNQHTSIHVRGARLAVVGIDDRTTGHDDVRAAFQGVPANGTRLVLAHNPLTARTLPSNAGLVCFSGHTHGGQIVLPGVTDALFACFGQPYIRGLHLVQGNMLYVNRGLGWGRKHNFLHRGSEPELAFFTLRCGRIELERGRMPVTSDSRQG